MDLYGKNDQSIPQKAVLVTLELLIITISFWILFLGGYNKIFSTDLTTAGNEMRHYILFIFNVIVFGRMSITMFYLINRHIPWEEAFSILFAFTTYYIGFALLGYEANISIDGLDIFATVLFLLGSFLNTKSEFDRNKWKKDQKNKRKLYTIGLFGYSMHINYFGDLLWVIAYALITRNWYAVIIPILIFCFFAFYNIPKLDKYLASKYGEQFEKYKQQTKKFIPFIY